MDQLPSFPHCHGTWRGHLKELKLISSRYAGNDGDTLPGKTNPFLAGGRHRLESLCVLSPERFGSELTHTVD